MCWENRFPWVALVLIVLREIVISVFRATYVRKGLAVPAMPLGSPGMETPQGHKDAFDTLLVLPAGASRVFARHNQPA